MAGLPLIELVKRQAISTFSKIASGISPNFEENLSNLKSLMNKVTSADVNLDTSLFHSDSSDSSDSGSQDSDAPVAHINIFEDPNLTVGIFVLKQGARLPLHDHPLMYGVLKVVHGTVRIQSYSILTDSEPKVQKEQENTRPSKEIDVNPVDIGLTKDTLYRPVVLLARKEPVLLISETDNVCVLSPLTGNLHEIHSVNGPAAFLDVLSPSYNTDIPEIGPRPCRYFKELEDDGPLENDFERPVKKLLRIAAPPDYWSRSAPYQGP